MIEQPKPVYDDPHKEAAFRKWQLNNQKALSIHWKNWKSVEANKDDTFDKFSWKVHTGRIQ